mmetsp:Transcript_90636/g.198696  ORF Transcript_90636/g.198696 Transcript_90636/m.198696 type:complete len:368 (-) Transcript_90636:887-1990(-)
MAAYAASASAHSARPPTAEAQAEASTAEPKEKKDDEKRLPGDKKSYKMPQRREASEMRSSMPDPNLAKLAAQRSAKMVAGVQMGCSLSVTGKIKAISLSLQKWPAVGTTTSSNSISIGSKNWKASFGNSVAKSTKGPRRAWKSIAPRMERSPSLRPSVEAMYSSNETKKVRILAFFSEPRDAAHVRTRSTNFKAVLGLLLSRREATATAVLGHSGAKGSPFSSESLAMMFNEAASLMVRRCGQPSPCLSSSSMFSASSSPSPSPSLSSPSPLSSLSPLSPSSSSSTTPTSPRLSSLSSSPFVLPPSPSSSSSLPRSFSKSIPWARATRFLSRASNFSAFSRASSSAVFVRSVAATRRSVPNFFTSMS